MRRLASSGALPSTLLITLLSFTTLPADAQLSAATSAASAPSADVAMYDGILQDLRQKLAHADERIAVAEQAVASQAEAQIGITPDQISQKAQYLRRLRRCYEDHMRHVTDLQALQQARQDLAQESGGEAGIAHPPPYSIDLLDELQAESDARKADVETMGVEAQRVKQTEELLQADKEQADRDERQGVRELTSNTDPAHEPRLRWLGGLAQVRAEAAAAALDQIRARREVLEATVALRKEELAFAQKKLAIALRPGNVLFGPKDLNNKLAEIDKRRVELRSELEKARLDADRKQDALAATTRSLQATSDFASQIQAQLTLAVSKTQADAAQTLVGSLEIRLDSLDSEAELWRIRQRALMGQIDRDMREKVHAILRSLELFVPSLQGDLRAVQAQIARANRSSEEQTLLRDPAYGRIQTALRQRETILEQTMNRLTSVRSLAQHALGEIDIKMPPEPWEQRLARYRATFRNVWEHEFLTIADNPITVGKIVGALLILAGGILFSRRVARATKRVAETRFRVDENVAATVEKMVYYALVALVTLLALSAVRIPLTVFTFLGGALAIGVGFGAQNLINNFISGLILLFERPIKIGDIVEIDGQTGRIINIGARCSQLRLFNGVDILVPNSVFLEKNVVNWTLAEPLRRFSITLGVSYGSPIEEVRRLMRHATENHPSVLKQPAPVVVFKDFGDSALLFETFYWLPLDGVTDSRLVGSDIRAEIDRMFKEAGIVFPFPQRDVHLTTLTPLQVEWNQHPSGESRNRNDP
ncbi:MAG TPA: mechanosensitive ion channel [Candidatus Hydrogenedentes bacterium]|nr:mechanosensitive ion channel [Candidatus Hydrogenedentota bacterium]